MRGCPPQTPGVLTMRSARVGSAAAIGVIVGVVIPQIIPVPERIGEAPPYDLPSSRSTTQQPRTWGPGLRKEVWEGWVVARRADPTTRVGGCPRPAASWMVPLPGIPTLPGIPEWDGSSREFRGMWGTITTGSPAQLGRHARAER